MRPIAIYCIFCLFLVFSCKKEKEAIVSQCDCVKLRTGILTSNPGLISPEIDTLRSADRDVLVERINQCDSLIASSTGTVIITNPAIYEIKISTDSLGTPICRTLDLVNRDEKRLRYLNIHLKCE
ncbi:MAG: hypothetical protein U0T82_08375 [Bacteroidales bacterium]